jgi:AmmeMemoRadiSam system protein A
MSLIEFNAIDRTTLLGIARESITLGFEQSAFKPIKADKYSRSITRPGASFVTIKSTDKLRGCVGALQAYQPLCLDVAEHAWAAAFSDHRFQSLARDELDTLSISISVLGEPEPLHFSSESDLLSKLRPYQDGLILQEGSKQATFLPSVWDSLAVPDDFLGQLKRKAGFAEDYWSDSLAFSRYSTDSFSEESE